MARHLLVLGCLAALPALAQPSGSAFKVQPSGGAVGTVCFYETVANGSNKICLKAPASIGSDADVDVSLLAPFWSRSGTNTYLANAGDFVGINTSTPTFQFTVESSSYTSGEHFPIGARAADASVAAVLGYRANGTTGTAGIVRAGGNKPLDLGTSSTMQAIRIHNDGTVGIGSTTDQTEIFYVSGDSKFTGHLFFSAPSTSDIGTSTNYGQSIYFENADFAPAGVTGNPTNVRKLNVFDKSGLTTFYDLQAEHSGSTVSGFYIRDPAGDEVLRLQRVLASTTVNLGTIDLHWVPKSDNTWSLGATGLDWLNINFDGSLIHNGTTLINSSRRWVPADFLFNTDGSSAIGTSSANRPGTIHVGAGTAGGAGVIVYNGSVARIIANAAQLSLYDNSSVEKIRLTSSSGDAIFAGTITVGACSGCSGSSLPVSDSTSIVEDNGDPTKEVRIEASGISTGTVRVWTAPNANITVAGINLAQTWTASQTFGSIFATDIQSGGFNFAVDSSGNTEVQSLNVNGTNLINSSRQWIGDLLFSTDNSVAIGGASANRPASVNSAGAVNVYNGSTQRVNIGNVTTLWKNASSTTTAFVDSGTGEVGLVSLTVNGTSNVIDSSRNGSFAGLTASGNLQWSGNLRGPFTTDTGLSFASSAGKIAYYDTSGNFKGWIPVLP